MPDAGSIALVVAGAAVAGFMNGLTGTGYALSALGFWLHAVPPQVAAPLVALCAVGGHAQALPRMAASMDWPRLRPFLIAGLIGVPLGVALLDRISAQPLKLTVGALLLVYVGWTAMVRTPPVVRGGGRIADAAIGFGGGFLGGLASISGPLPIVWAQLRGWGKDEQRGITQPYNMAILAFVLVAAAVGGLLDLSFLFWAAIALPISMLGTRAGLAVYARLSDSGFRRIVLAFLAVSGLVLIGTSIRALEADPGLVQDRGQPGRVLRGGVLALQFGK
ncbi:MAG: sulfite exporter TauE/SafE family protein [Alphaproteobacteria bacterium]|nr:sulfite exporter TauE/SafE family protein [Alphaproteobacteria bacterium]